MRSDLKSPCYTETLAGGKRIIWVGISNVLASAPIGISLAWRPEEETTLSRHFPSLDKEVFSASSGA